MLANPAGAMEIVYCYAREDEKLRERLEKHLTPFKRSGKIIAWYDLLIEAGRDWKQEMEIHLSTANIILVLVSPDFMASDYCYSIELQRALERHQMGKAVVIPIILRPVYWQVEPLNQLQALPKDGKPITVWHNRDQAFLDVTMGILKVVTTLMEKEKGHIEFSSPSLEGLTPDVSVAQQKQMERWKELQELQTTIFDLAQKYVPDISDEDFAPSNRFDIWDEYIKG